jgi:hypothetical protein
MYAGQRPPTGAQKAPQRLRDQQELEKWQRNFRLLEQIGQKWDQIIRELEEDFLDREAFDGYRQSIRRLCLNNDFRIKDRRLK